MEPSGPLEQWRFGRLEIERWPWTWTIGLGYISENGFKFLYVGIGSYQVRLFVGDELL